jgi:hypothetical protein
VAALPDGLSRSDLLAAGAAQGHTRPAVLVALHDLELDGWLGEVDGVLRFEHPLIRDGWLAGSPDPGADDIPF